MDPNQTYVDMIAALQEQDLETARTLALALKNWLATGGFYPSQYPAEKVHSSIENVLNQTAGIDAEPVFSLICCYCDAGADIPTREQAIAEGWTGIELALDLQQANFCGICPECRELED